MRKFFEKHFDFSPLRLFLVAIFLISIVAYFGYQRWESRFEPKYREAVPPKVQSDGTIHYTLYHAEVNEGPTFFVPWKLAIAKEIYVQLPESLNNDPFLGKFVPNTSVTLYFNPEIMSFVSEEKAKKHTSYERMHKYISVSIRGSLDNRTFNYLLERQCNLGKEIAPKVFKLKSKDNKRSGFCEYVDEDNVGLALVQNENIIATGKCRSGCRIIGKFGRGYKVHLGFKEQFLGELSAVVDAIITYLDVGAEVEGNPNLDQYAEFEGN